MQTTTSIEKPVNKTESRCPEWVRLVQQSVGSLQFGVVQIVVHNSRVVQIEKTEKMRLDHEQ
jgi:hypothetical protein